MRFLPGLAISLALSLLGAASGHTLPLVPIGLNHQPAAGNQHLATLGSASDPEGRTLVVVRRAGVQPRLESLLLDPRAAPLAEPRLLATTSGSVEATVAVGPQDGFVAAWTETVATGDVRVRLALLRDGEETVSVLEVNGATPPRFRRSPAVACRSGVGCLVAWFEVEGTTGPRQEYATGRVLARRLDAEGNLRGGILTVATQQVETPSLALRLTASGTALVLRSAGFVQPITAQGSVLLHLPVLHTLPVSGTPSELQLEPTLSDRSTAWVELLATATDAYLAIWQRPTEPPTLRLAEVAANGSAGAVVSHAVPLVVEAAAWQSREETLVLVGASAVHDAEGAPIGSRVSALGLDPVTGATSSLLRLSEAEGLTVARLDAEPGLDGSAWAFWTEGPEGALDPAGKLRAQRVFVGGSPCIGFPPVPCAPLAGDERFVAWINYRDPDGTQFLAPPLPLTTDTAGFTFTSAEVPEIVVKVLDGRALNDRFWVFYASLTDQEFSLVVEDRETGAIASYYNRQGRLASSADTSAFADGPPASATVAHDPELLASLFTSAPAAEPVVAAVCPSVGDRLCLLDGQFTVEVTWQDFTGGSGSGQPTPLSANGGTFTFFDPANIELAVKLLDGRAVNGRYWLFYASLTSVPFTLTVRDASGAVLVAYENPSGTLASVADVEAF